MRLAISARADRLLEPGCGLLGCAQAAQKAGHSLCWQLLEADGPHAERLRSGLAGMGFDIAGTEPCAADIVLAFDCSVRGASLQPRSDTLTIVVEDRGGRIDRNPLAHVPPGRGLRLAAADPVSRRHLQDAGARDILDFPLVADMAIWHRPLAVISDRGPLVALRGEADDWSTELLPPPEHRHRPRPYVLRPTAPEGQSQAQQFPPDLAAYVDFSAFRSHQGLGPLPAALASGLVVVLGRDAPEDYREVAICCEPEEAEETLTRNLKSPGQRFDSAERAIAFAAQHFAPANFLAFLQRCQNFP